MACTMRKRGGEAEPLLKSVKVPPVRVVWWRNGQRGDVSGGSGGAPHTCGALPPGRPRDCGLALGQECGLDGRLAWRGAAECPV